MKVLGITGGVGAGKSSVLRFLEEEYGAVVRTADETAHELMEPGAPCYAPVVAYFGGDIVEEDGRIDRKKLAARVFGKPTELEKLNAMVHPRVREALKKLAEDFEGPLLVLESALPCEAGLDRICDELWFVQVSTEERIRRLALQRGYTGERSRSMMESQLSDEEFTALSDRVLDNSGTREDTMRKIREMMKEAMAK